MTSGTCPTPEPDRRELEHQLQQAVENARASLKQATDRVGRAEAAERLRVAVKKLMEFTWQRDSTS